MKKYFKILMILIFVYGCAPYSSLKTNTSDIYVKLVTGSESEMTAYISVPKDTEDVTVCINDTGCDAKSGLNGVESLGETSDRKIFKMQRGFSSEDTLTILRGVASAVKRSIKFDKGGLIIDVGELASYLIDLPVVRETKQAGWGDVLTDIVQHYYEHAKVPGGCGAYTTYASSDVDNFAHEATHGLNSCIKNKFTTETKERVYGFYLLQGKAIYVKYPSVSRSRIAGFVPANLQKASSTSGRYSLYVVSTAAGWDTPLYMFDEWVAYSNGAREAINQLDNHRSMGNFVKLGEGALEFMVYVTATALAIESYDNSYFNKEPRFVALYKHLSEVLMKDIMASKHNKVTDNDMRAYFKKFQTDNSAAQLRSWIKRYCGESWAKEVFGI